MRYARFVLLVGLLGLAPSVAGQSHGDFSGTWMMDSARSESAHQDVPIGPSTLRIRVTDTELIMETTRSEGGKPAAFHETLTLRLDGSDTTGASDTDATVTGKAHWDGAKLVVGTSREINGATVTTLYVHKLSANGLEMTIDKTLTVQHGYQGLLSARNMGHGVDVFVRGAR
jgi:hypothetical protein